MKRLKAILRFPFQRRENVITDVSLEMSIIRDPFSASATPSEFCDVWVDRAWLCWIKAKLGFRDWWKEV